MDGRCGGGVVAVRLKFLAYGFPAENGMKIPSESRQEGAMSFRPKTGNRGTGNLILKTLNFKL